MNDLPIHCGQVVDRIIGRTNVITDIKPYRSTVTGEMIDSRTKHREHLKRHNLEEIGNEIPAHMKVAGKRIKPKRKDDSRKRLIAEKLNSL